MTSFDYAYAAPADAVNILAILPPGATDDYQMAGFPVPVPFSQEIGDDGMPLIYTDQAAAVCRYVAYVNDPARFSPLFTMALSWHLAGFLAGPLLKGTAGAAMVKHCTAMMQQYLAQAVASDSNQGPVNRAFVPSLISRR